MSGNICRCGTYLRIREAISRLLNEPDKEADHEPRSTASGAADSDRSSGSGNSISRRDSLALAAAGLTAAAAADILIGPNQEGE